MSGRLWYRPTSEWEFQVSTGHLVAPEALEPGNIERSTASVAWTQRNGSDCTAVSAGYGRNDTDHGALNAVFLEGARHAGLNSLYGRFEVVQRETALLLSDQVPDATLPNVKDPVFALTVGAVRDVLRLSGWEGGIGADLTLYGAPASLTSTYGNHPVGVRVFFRLRPPVGSMGRMLNTRMAQPMAGEHDVPMTHPMP